VLVGLAAEGATCKVDLVKAGTMLDPGNNMATRETTVAMPKEAVG
jgi:hypothetical protein